MRDDDAPLTLKQAAGTIFPDWTYGQLRNRVRALIAEGMPAVKEGRSYLLYPRHIEAWRISKYPADARRALRAGGYDVSTGQNVVLHQSNHSAERVERHGG